MPQKDKQPEELTFTPLAPEHIPALAVLDKTAPDPWSEAEITAELQKPQTRCTVAIQNGVPVAFACFWREEEVADLATVTVDAAVRGKGIGKALLQHCIAALAVEGTERALLEVRCSNTPALALYERLGFCTLATRKNLYTDPREDGLLMQLTLNSAQKIN